MYPLKSFGLTQSAKGHIRMKEGCQSGLVPKLSWPHHVHAFLAVPYSVATVLYSTRLTISCHFYCARLRFIMRENFYFLVCTEVAVGTSHVEECLLF